MDTFKISQILNKVSISVELAPVSQLDTRDGAAPNLAANSF